MPRPPPPAAAFTMTGRPILWASASRLASLWSAPWYPGTQGTPASIMRRLAAALLPIAAMAVGGGPMKVRPAFWQAVAKASFSDRNP